MRAVLLNSKPVRRLAVVAASDAHSLSSSVALCDPVDRHHPLLLLRRFYLLSGLKTDSCANSSAAGNQVPGHPLASTTRTTTCPRSSRSSSSPCPSLLICHLSYLVRQLCATSETRRPPAAAIHRSAHQATEQRPTPIRGGHSNAVLPLDDPVIVLRFIIAVPLHNRHCARSAIA